MTKTMPFSLFLHTVSAQYSVKEQTTLYLVHPKKQLIGGTFVDVTIVGNRGPNDYGRDDGLQSWWVKKNIIKTSIEDKSRRT